MEETWAPPRWFSLPHVSACILGREENPQLLPLPDYKAELWVSIVTLSHWAAYIHLKLKFQTGVWNGNCLPTACPFSRWNGIRSWSFIPCCFLAHFHPAASWKGCDHLENLPNLPIFWHLKICPSFHYCDKSLVSRTATCGNSLKQLLY